MLCGRRRNPAPLSDIKLSQAGQSRLRCGGVILINMADDSHWLLTVLAHAFQAVWRYPCMLDSKSTNPRNVIAMAGAVRDLKAVKSAMGAHVLAKGLSGFSFRKWR